MVDPSDDVGEGGTTITNECQGARSRLVRAYRVILILIPPMQSTGSPDDRTGRKVAASACLVISRLFFLL